MQYKVSSTGTIKSFTDLVAWQEAHRLAVEIYKTTKSFPVEEQYGLVAQMRRAAVSVTSNIAEGFSRSTAAEKANFYSVALGSITELQNQILLCRDVDLLSKDIFSTLAEKSVTVHKLISSLMKAIRSGKGIRAKPA